MALEEKIKETEGFPKVFFGMTENLEFQLPLIGNCYQKNVLAVAGSGDSIISFLIQRAKVTAVDISATALHWTKTKIAFVNQLSSEEYTNLMDALNPNQKRTYDFGLAQKSILSINLPEWVPNLKDFFISPEHLQTQRDRFFYTTRDYREDLSPHSFRHPGPIPINNLQLVQGDIISKMNFEYGHIHLSNILDYIFIRNSKIKYFPDDSPDYSAMPDFQQCPEREERLGLLKRISNALSPQGKAISFTAAYFSPYQKMFIACAQEAGLRTECHEFPSRYHHDIKDFYLVYHKN